MIWCPTSVNTDTLLPNDCRLPQSTLSALIFFSEWQEDDGKDTDNDRVTEKSTPRQSQVAVTLQW